MGEESTKDKVLYSLISHFCQVSAHIKAPIQTVTRLATCCVIYVAFILQRLGKTVLRFLIKSVSQEALESCTILSKKNQ